MAASTLYIGISRNVNCDNMVSFPKSGNIYVYLKIFIRAFINIFVFEKYTARLTTVTNTVRFCLNQYWIHIGT